MWPQNSLLKTCFAVGSLLSLATSLHAQLSEQETFGPFQGVSTVNPSPAVLYRFPGAEARQQNLPVQTNLPDTEMGISQQQDVQVVVSQEQLTVQDGQAKAVIEPAQQSASPVRKIPELAAPNTNLKGIGTGLIPKDALEGFQIEERGLPVGTEREGDWTRLSGNWQASAICHLPLYFEEPMLERNGQQRFPCLQPMISGAHFFGNIAMLPYSMQMNRPWCEQSALGSYRPGTCAPALYRRPPFRADAATAQGVAATAFFFAVP
ncbi:MAG: hypothetical protein RLY14_819 [Planctomycetota bacterium]|jgi:hypothetical protein